MSGIATLIQILLILVAVFLILVVLVQRGRGGGLAGALGGMGGQSAFGTKAGDTFTKITIWTAVVWILLCIVSVKYLNNEADRLGNRNAAEKENLSAPATGTLPGAGENDMKGSAAPGSRNPPAKGAGAPVKESSRPASKDVPPPAPAPVPAKDSKNP